MALVEAYFDESGTQYGSPVMCVAGYVFEKEASKRLAVDWEALLDFHGLPFFRMSSCAHQNGVFKAVSRDTCIAIETRAIELIKAHASFGMMASVSSPTT